MNLLLLLLIPLLVQSAKLNVPRVLLPYNHGTASNFTLKVHEGGCYKWTSSRDEVKLSEVYSDEECSNEAVVSAITKSPTRLTAIILAKDIGTGFSLRCDVIIDSFHRLEIVTTTRELFAEEAPEEFEVRAYDLYGNEFSTLEGQVFVWDLQTITDHKAVVAAQTVLRFITFEASPYETPPAIAPLESIGEQGSRVLIEGRQTGLARLSVRMGHPSYKNLQPAEVNLMVIANLILEPQDVYILPRTTVQYSVFHLKQGIFHPVEIEGSQYYLQISDESVASLEDDGISASGLSLGSTSVILRDNNVKSSQTLKQPTATLNVVDPSYLTITILPHDNPALIVNQPYIFLINIYDKNNNKIYLTEAVVVETLIPSDFITTEFISKNGTYIEGIPHQIGTTKIIAKLTAIEVNDEILEISPPLKASLTVDIFDRIKVRPSIVMLPWDPITKPYYNFNLTTEGAHGSVTWASKDTSLVQVNTLGQCQTLGNGMTNVMAALTINPHNNDDAKIYVQEVLQLNILDVIFEVEVDQPLTLAIGMGSLVKGAEMLFSQCHQLPLKVITQDDFYSNDFKASSVNESCVSVDLSSPNSGFSTVSVSYQSTTGLLEDSVVISAFKPLHPISPLSGETVLAIGTSRLVLFEGGPLPWINKPSSHFAKVEYENSDLLTAEVIESRRKEDPDIHAVFVDCLTLGEMNITLHVGNKPSTTLPFPVLASSTIKVICALPDSIILSSATPKKEGCPDRKDVQAVVAHCYKPFSMKVTVKDSEGRNFDNVSSLSIGWSVSEPTLASFAQEETQLMNSHIVYGFHVPVSVQQNLIPFGTPGELSVSASITGFKDPLKDIQIPRLQDNMKVFLVKDAQLSPSELVLFNHKENQGEVQITGGSGQFQLAKVDEEIAMYEFMPQNNKIIVFPMADGNTTLILKDLCLDLVTTPVSVIRISSLGFLDLFMRERVEVGMSITAEVVARDINGNHIPYHTLMNITPHPNSNIIDLSFETINDNGNAVYLISGKTVGKTSLKMSVQKGSSFMYSPSRPLQVFPALTIHPRNLTLIVGAVFQVETNGGPSSDCSIVFVMENETISSVSHTGVVTALSLGTTRLTARAVSVHADGEEMITYSQDSVMIRVIPLESIHIHSPLKNIETGYSMPLYAMGGDSSQNPLSYGTVISPLLFEWSLSNKQIASFKTLYSENGIAESKENQGIVRFKALKPGRISVSLKVSVTVPHSSVDYQIKNNVVLTDKIELKVFETLKLKNPINEDGKILLSPNSKTKISTNRDKEGILSYKVKCNNQSETSPIISVSSDGVIKAENRHGDTSVLVSLEEQFGVTQSLSILVEVRPIAYLEIESTPFMKVAGKNLFATVPIGISHELKVLSHDHRGRIFTATNTALEFRQSRFDLVNVQRGSFNDTILVTIRNAGQTVLHVWDNSNPLLADYFKINSGPGIDPDRTSIPFGSFICFSSNLRSTSGEFGTWKSDNSALEIDPLLGIGVAYQVGKASISYQVSSSVGTTTELLIVPIKKILIHPPSEILSNVKRENGSFIRVSFEGENKNTPPSPHCFPENSLFSPNVPFTCLLSFDSVLQNTLPRNIFTATASYIPGEGFGCVLESLFDSDVTFATSGVKLMLGVSVVKSGLQEDVETPLSDIPFIPAAVSDKTEVVLTDIDQVTVVVLHGSQELLSSFSLDFDDRYIIAQIESIEQTKCNLVISSKEAIWSGSSPLNPISLYLISSLTQQKIKIDISFEKISSDTCPDSGKRIGIVGFLLALASHYQSALFSLLCVVITVICLLFGYYTVASPGYKQTQNTGVFASSNLPAPVSPGNSIRNRSVTSLSPASSSSPPGASNLRHFQQSPKGIPLWSVDQEPVYGDPLFRSSPRPAYDGSPTYTRNTSIH